MFRLNMRTGRYQVLHMGSDIRAQGARHVAWRVIDGAAPDHGGLVVHNGRLYGLTTYGTRNGGGAMFSVKPDGTQYRLIGRSAPRRRVASYRSRMERLVTGPGNWLYA